MHNSINLRSLSINRGFGAIKHLKSEAKNGGGSCFFQIICKNIDFYFFFKNLSSELTSKIWKTRYKSMKATKKEVEVSRKVSL